MKRDDLKKIREEDKKISQEKGNKTGFGTTELFLISPTARKEVQHLIETGHIKEAEFELGLDIDTIIDHAKPLFCSLCGREHIVAFHHSATGICYICKECFKKGKKTV